MKQQRGAAMVEFAVVGLVFFTLVFGLIELFIRGYQEMSLQYLSIRAVRQGVIDRSNANAVFPNLFVKEALKLEAAGWGYNLLDSNISICPITAPGCGDQNIPDESFFIVQVSIPGFRILNPNNFNVVSTVFGINATPVKITYVP